jgi:hypothetical protein
MDQKLLRYDYNSLFTFIDFETFNLCLNPYNNLPWQAAIIQLRNNKKVSVNDLYIKWDSPLKISEDAARITRFNHDLFNQKCVSANEACKIIADRLDETDYIVGHNILNFDVFLMKIVYDFLGKDYKPLVNKMIDTNCLSKAFLKSFKKSEEDDLLSWQYRLLNFREKGLKTALSTMGKLFNIEHNYDGLHDGICDLELNIKLWDKLKFSIEI